VLVTGRFDEKQIIDGAEKLGVSILPKTFIGEIVIR
jgi:hypothetical protein